MFGTVHLTYKRKRLAIDVYSDFSGGFRPNQLALRTLENPTLFPANELGERFSPAWFTLNIKASYDIVKYLTVNAGIENLTDNRYRTYSSGIAAPGVNFVVGLRGRF
jgi:hemoglobin/transferrin/lactoferrin receptor protein